jgi:hypothetical protein
MVDGIGLAITSIKSATEIVKGAIDLRDEKKINDALQEVNAKLLATQELMLAAYEERLAIHKRVEELEKMRMEIENWEREADRYSLKQLVPTVLVYALKEPVQGSEPVHYICPNCYNDRKKSLLHRRPSSFDGEVISCDNCSFEQHVGQQRSFSRSKTGYSDNGGWM